VYHAKSSSRSHCAFEVYILLLEKREERVEKKDLTTTYQTRSFTDRTGRRAGSQQVASSHCNPANTPCKNAAPCIWIVPAWGSLQIRAGMKMV